MIKRILLIIVSISLFSSPAMAGPWKLSPVENLSSGVETLGLYKLLKIPFDECKAWVNDGAELDLKNGDIKVDRPGFYSLEYMEGAITLTCNSIHGKLTQAIMFLPADHDVAKGLEIKR